MAVLGASVLGGITGSGFALVCTPLLLLAGFPLADVVVVNLTISGTTRLATVARLRRSVNRRRAGWLVFGVAPGLAPGLLVRGSVDDDVLEVFAGSVAVGVTLYLLLRPPAGDPAVPPAGRAAGVRRRHGNTCSSATLTLPAIHLLGGGLALDRLWLLLACWRAGCRSLCWWSRVWRRW